MIIGICSTRNHRYHPNRRLLEAAGQLGHRGVLLHPGKYTVGLGVKGPTVEPVRGGFVVDVVLPRIGASIKEYGLTMVRHFELCGIPVVNPYASILLASNKFLCLQALCRQGIPIPESRYASNWSNFEKARSLLGGYPLVVKAPRSRQGSGVFLLESKEQGKAMLEGMLHQGQGVLLQEFIPPSERRDIRIVMAGKRALGAMTLTPRQGDFRANIHLRGKAVPLTPTGEMLDLARRAVRTIRLDIAGVDMIEDRDGKLRVIEVNYSPGFKGLEKCTGRDIAIEIVEYVTRLAQDFLCRSPF